MKQALHGEIVQDVRVFWGKSSGKTEPQRKQIQSLVVKAKRVSGLPVKDDVLVKELIKVSKPSFITDLLGSPGKFLHLPLDFISPSSEERWAC